MKNLTEAEARSIANLSADMSLTRQAITKHLHVLERAGIVSTIRVGRESRFTDLLASDSMLNDDGMLRSRLKRWRFGSNSAVLHGFPNNPEAL